MKTILLAAGLVLLAGCSKSTDWDWSNIFDGNGNGDRVVTLKVLESKSNLPVAGATVVAERCSNYDIEFGCVGFATIATLITDAQGACTVTTNYSIERVQASHPSYWPDWTKGSQYVYLKPEAWARVHLRKVNSYPENCQMTIGKSEVWNPWNSPNHHAYTLRFNVPSDTTVMIRLYGEEQDKIWWDVKQGNTLLREGNVSPPIIPKWTTADVTIDF